MINSAVVMNLSKCGGVCHSDCPHYAIGRICPADATYPEPVICGVDTICKGLDTYIEGANFETNKGFCTVHVVDLKTGITRLFGVAYKRRKADKGVMLNFCPFCGNKPGTFI